MRVCFDRYVNASCESVADRAEGSSCTQGLRGLVPTGGACTDNLECADGLCGSSGTCPGACEHLRASGGSRSSASECAIGLACSGGLCVVPVAVGEPCGSSAQGATCTTSAYCRNDSATATGKCTPISQRYLGGEGDDCLVDGVPCESGLACTATGATASGGAGEYRCQRVSISGGPCRFAIPGACPPGEYCPVSILDGTAAGNCTPRVPIGGACSSTTLVPCVGDATCSDSGACVAIQRLGGPCGSDTECYSAACRQGVCAPNDDCSS